MSEEIIKKVRDFLGEHDDTIMPEDLYEKLRSARNNIHPDKFQGREVKVACTERFKEANRLLGELKQYIDQQYALACTTNHGISKLSDTKTKLFLAYAENDDKENEIKRLELSLSCQIYKTEELEKKNKELNETILQKQNEITDVNALPKKGHVISLGVFGVISLVMLILINIDNASEIARKHLPFDIKYLNWAVTIFICLVILFAIHYYIDYLIIKNKSKNICSNSFCGKFIQYLDDNKKTDSGEGQINIFGELDVITFIINEYAFQKHFYNISFITAYSHRTLELLKDNFIVFAENNNYISFSEVKSFQKFYKITGRKSKSKYEYD